MKKIYSLIKACMSKDMNIFKIKRSRNKKISNIIIPIFIALYLMFLVWGMANSMFEKLSLLHLQYVVLSMFAFAVSLFTLIEGIYKIGPLIYNCKDNDLLFSLPIKKSTILFIRVLKFYIFELLFNSIFLVPVVIAYIRWGEYITWTYYLTSFIMIILLPIIPIVLSMIIGAIITSLSSKFKHKNLFQILISMIFLVIIFYMSFTTQNIYNYLIINASNINSLITKIYYPAYIYGKLAINFNINDLLLFIFINIILLIVSILLLSKFYFKINSRLKNNKTVKKTKINNLKIKSNNKTISLIKKELNTFFNTPVFIINAGFSLVLFIIIAIIISIKFNSYIPLITNIEDLKISYDLIMNNRSLIILILLIVTSFMTYITCSFISLEGKNISILKSLPVNAKTILLSKALTGLVITTPLLIIGNIILFISLNINIFESLLLLLSSIIIPLVSHFLGILINLKYPKLDALNSTEVVKQSASSLVSSIVGIILIPLNIGLIIFLVGKISSFMIILIIILIYIIVDIILYNIIIHKGVKIFNQLN